MGRTLVITAGKTPQVVTETVWALARPPRAWRPDRMFLATTASGARLYRKGDPRRGVAPLLGERGRLAELWAILWPQAPMPLVETCVAERRGRPLEDLRTAEEVEGFAEMLLSLLAGITAQPDEALHVSLAGGRKTMSFLAGQVMSLLGRPEDVLSHVLVEPAALEREPRFWWPGDGAPGSEIARVHLHEVPYLRARAWVEPERLLAGPEEGLYARMVARANQALGAVDARLDLGACRLQVGCESIDFTPSQAALVGLVFIARRRGLELERLPWTPTAETQTSAVDHEPALAGDRAEARRLWAWLRAAAEFERKSRNRPGGPLAWFFERVAAMQTVSVDYDQAIVPHASRARRALRTRLPTRLAGRILSVRPLSTGLEAGRIRISAPSALAEHPDRPPEVELA